MLWISVLFFSQQVPLDSFINFSSEEKIRFYNTPWSNFPVVAFVIDRVTVFVVVADVTVVFFTVLKLKL